MPYEGDWKNSQSLNEWVTELSTAAPTYSSPDYLQGEPNQITFEYGYLMISLVGLSFLAIVTAFYRRRFKLLINVFFNWKLSKQIIRYEKVHSHPVNILLLITFLIFFPLFYAQAYSELSESIEFWSILKYVALALLVYSSLKFILYKFSAWLFEESELFEQYIFQLNLFSKFMGILMLFLWIFLIYSPFSTTLLFKLSLLLLLLFLVMQSVRGFIIGRSEGKHLLLIILYLCSLEILPWLLIYKGLDLSW